MCIFRSTPRPHPSKMYRRSPILRAALSPSSQTIHSRVLLSDKIDQKLARIRILSGAYCDAGSVSPCSVSSRRPVVQSSPAVMAEIQQVHSIVTELISLFQDYRTSVDSRIDGVAADLEARLSALIDVRDARPHDRVSDTRPDIFSDECMRRIAALEQLVGESFAPKSNDVRRLREELLRVKEDQARLMEKVRGIHRLNCESHQRSSLAMKALRDLINRNSVV